MKKVMFLLFSVLCLTIFFLVSSVSAAGTITMKIGLSNKPGSPRVMGAELFGKLIKERTGGKVDVKIFPSSQLGKTRQMIEQIQMGSLECLITPTAFFGGFNRMITVVDLPFLFPSIEVYYKVMNGPFGEELAKESQKVKIQTLAFWTAGWKQFTSNFEVRKPSDFKGHKIRVMPSPPIMAQYRSYGATPVPIAFKELYNALQLGTVDGQENMLYRNEEMKFYEVQKYITISNHALMPEIVIVGKAWWDKLPADIQQKMIAAFREIAPKEAAWIEKKDVEALAIFKKHGTTVNKLTPSERDAFEKLAPIVWDKFASEYGEKANYYVEKLKSAIAAAQ